MKIYIPICENANVCTFYILVCQRIGVNLSMCMQESDNVCESYYVCENDNVWESDHLC